jgi:hypothetical protein
MLKLFNVSAARIMVLIRWFDNQVTDLLAISHHINQELLMYGSRFPRLEAAKESRQLDKYRSRWFFSFTSAGAVSTNP